MLLCVTPLQALDERSLLLLVDDAGTITSVGDSPASLFGFSPAVLVGQSIASCITSLEANGGSDN